MIYVGYSLNVPYIRNGPVLLDFHFPLSIAKRMNLCAFIISKTFFLFSHHQSFNTFEYLFNDASFTLFSFKSSCFSVIKCSLSTNKKDVLCQVSNLCCLFFEYKLDADSRFSISHFIGMSMALNTLYFDHLQFSSHDHFLHILILIVKRQALALYCSS